MNLADGDRVTLAGKIKGGVFYAKAMRNNQTNVVYSEPSILYISIGALLFAIGIPLLFVVIGFLIVPLSAYLIWDGWQNLAALKALQTA